MYSHDRTIASAQVIDQLLPDLTADERKLAKEPGMGGRIWFGQGLVFDEAYGILMTLGILTDPKQTLVYQQCKQLVREARWGIFDSLRLVSMSVFDESRVVERA